MLSGVLLGRTGALSRGGGGGRDGGGGGGGGIAPFKVTAGGGGGGRESADGILVRSDVVMVKVSL